MRIQRYRIRNAVHLCVLALAASLLSGLAATDTARAETTLYMRLSSNLDLDGDFVDDLDADPEEGEDFLVTNSGFATVDLTTLPVPGFEASANASISGRRVSTDPLIDMAIELSRVFDDIEAANLGSAGAVAEVEIDFVANITHEAGGFTSDTVELEATIGIEGSIDYEWLAGGPSGRGSLLLGFSDQGFNSDQKGIFHSAEGGIVGNTDLAGLFTSNSGTRGGNLFRDFVAEDGELVMTIQVPVLLGGITDEQALRMAFGVEGGYLNTSGGPDTITERFSAQFLGNSISLKSLRATDPDVTLTIIPEPGTALAVLLGLAGLSRVGRPRT